MRRITIKETRQSIEEQIVEVLEERGDYSFEENGQDDVTVTLVSGQQMNCCSARLIDGKVVLTLSLLNVQDFDVSSADISIESLDKILAAIKHYEHWVSIYALNQGDSAYIFGRDIKELPKTATSAEVYLRDIIPCAWEQDGQMSFVFYPDKRFKDRYLRAFFE